MLNIKKYANGRFFDTATKKYIKPETLAELIKKGEKIHVTLTKTGKDITDTVIAQFSKKEDQKKEGQKKEKKEIPFLKTDKLVKWLGEVIDSKIEKVMEVIKLPTREQVASLDENIKALNKKIDALKVSQEKTTKKRTISPKKEAAPKKATATPETTVSKETVPEDKKPVTDPKDIENKTETKTV